MNTQVVKDEGEAGHAFFNLKNFIVLIVCGVVLMLAGTVLLLEDWAVPARAQLRRVSFAGPVEVSETEIEVHGATIPDRSFHLPDGQKIVFSHSQTLDAVAGALTSPGALEVAIGGAPDVELYALEKDGHAVITYEQSVAEKHARVGTELTLLLAGFLLAAAVIWSRRRFLSAG